MKPSRKARSLVRRLDDAAQSFAFMGSADPDDHEEIQANYDTAKDKLLAYIAERESRGASS